MGFLSFIGDKLQEANMDYQEAQARAERMDPRRICEELQDMPAKIESVAYIEALKTKCRKMKKRELINIFNYARQSRNAKAFSAIKSVMEEKGLISSKENI